MRSGRDHGLQGILFDYSGTVLLSNGFDLEAGLREMCSALTLPEGTSVETVVSFAIATELAFQEIRDQTQFEFSFDKFLHVVIDYFGAHTTRTLGELESLYYDAAVSYKVAPGIEVFLKTAMEAGIRTGVVSNSTNAGWLLQRQIEKNGLDKLFQFTISSADYGIRKQHPLLFHIALSKLGLPKENVIFIGDSLEYDIKTAQTAGLAAVWYNQKKLPRSDTISPDYAVEAWDAIDLAKLKPVGRDGTQGESL